MENSLRTVSVEMRVRMAFRPTWLSQHTGLNKFLGAMRIRGGALLKHSGGL